MNTRTYCCIDLKSFYASVECVERKLDPLTTNLVVADESRTEKTICLAVTPSLKQYGLSGRSRLYEVVQKVKEVNMARRRKLRSYKFTGKSSNDNELKNHPELELDYIIAPPRMKLYMKYSTDIYNTYIKYISEEDVFVYSIDEVFMDITEYLKVYHLSAEELVTKMINEVYSKTGITATAGIGTNLYLAKIAMDIVAKHANPNNNGVRVAKLDEMSYRRLLWNHTPITDFWRVGRGYEKKLSSKGLYTMGDIALQSVKDEEVLYKLFGVNAELLIDHAWGYEPCTVKSVKSYKPSSSSLSSGQVLHEPYNYKKAQLIVQEMTDNLVLDLVDKRLVTDQLVLTIGYDISNLTDNDISSRYDGDVTTDYYGRTVPKSSHGTVRLDYKTSSTKEIMKAVVGLYKKIANPLLLVRRINIAACNLEDESKVKDQVIHQQLDLFSSPKANDINKEELEKEKELQRALLSIKKKYGKNSIVKGMDLMDGATTIQRNNEVGGHKG